MLSIPPVPDDHPPVACRAARRPWLDGGMGSYDAFLLVSFGFQFAMRAFAFARRRARLITRIGGAMLV